MPMLPASLFEGSLVAPRKPTPAEANLALTGMAAAKADADAGDWAGLCRYRAADRVMLAAGRLPRAVFMGDSITDDWDDANPPLFAGEQVANGLVDRGIGGQTTQQMLLRFSQDVLALRPRAVHLLGGTNDILAIGGSTEGIVTLGDTEANIRAMIALASGQGIAVVVGTLPPMAGVWDTKARRAAILELNAWLRATARKESLALADYHAVLTDRNGGFKVNLTIDGVHPNRVGFLLMEQLMGAALGRALPE
jgi:lysophospholipase L1-like esterase